MARMTSSLRCGRTTVISTSSGIRLWKMSGVWSHFVRLQNDHRRSSQKTQGFLRRVPVAYIRLQLVDGVGLVSDNGVHQVADGNHSDQFPPGDNGEMPNPVLSHDSHAGFNRVIRTDGHQRGRHDLPHLSVFR